MSTARLIEILGGGSAKYQLSPPWKGRRFVVVAPMTLLNGKALTHVYAADETGIMTPATDEGNPSLLDTMDGHPSHQQVLRRFGYRLT